MDLPDGYHRLPPGKLANAVTWLEMLARPEALPGQPLRLVAVERSDAALYGRLCAAVGTPWLWSCAYRQPSSEDEARDAHVAVDDAGTPIGVVEFAGRKPAGRGGEQQARDVEIVYFGLVPAATGAGLGRRLMAAALDLAWASARRVWLHTCNFDHPGALRFYQGCGFAAYASGFEIMDDPRLDGSLPRGAAPHVPLIDPSPIAPAAG